MTYAWCRVNNQPEWEKLTQQKDWLPDSYPLLVGLVAEGETYTVVPLPFTTAKELMKNQKTPRKKKAAK